MMLKIKCFGMIAGCALATGSLCAADYNQTFESDKGTWTGTLLATNYTYNGVAGKPLPSADHTKVLVIEGDSSYDASSGGFSGSPLVDMMVQAALPDDALEDPEEGAHIAIAVDTNGIFNVYCKNKSNPAEAGWYPLSSTPYADGAWARVSLLFDYANGRCQVRLDGQPMMTANGYLDATTTDTTKNGAWYPLASTGSSVSNLKVVGCTAIDDVVIAANAEGYAMTANATNDVGVSCAWLDKYGLAWDAATAGTSYDSSGMTVAQKYDACLSPFDDQKFEIKSVKATDTKTQVGIPKTIAVPGREVVLEYGSSPSMGSETPVTAGAETVEIDLPLAGEVKYFRLKAKAQQATD